MSDAWESQEICSIPLVLEIKKKISALKCLSYILHTKIDTLQTSILLCWNSIGYHGQVILLFVCAVGLERTECDFWCRVAVKFC